MTDWMPDTEICNCAFNIGVDEAGGVVFKKEILRCQKHKSSGMLPEHLFNMIWEEQNKLAAERVPDDGV